MPAPNETKTILIIDDDVDICVLLSNFLKKHNYHTKYAFTGKSGIEECKNDDIDLVLCDYRLGDMEGADCLQKIKSVNKGIIVIMITAYADIRKAIASIKSGAFDYINKPLVPDDMLNVIKKAFECKNGIPPAVTKKQEDDGEETPQEEFVKGHSPAAALLYRQVKLAAPTNYNIILEGSSGTGKEVIARNIHLLSKRKDKPFVAIDCGVLSRELAGSELFGHVKGAFTGAIADKTGHFELANGGTLFLDEVSNLPYNVQAILLRVTQERRFKKIGGLNEQELDIRIIVATNENLRDAYRKGKFREDLYHRLNEFAIKMPDLVERKEDIPLFADFILKKVNKELDKEIEGFDEQVMELFRHYSWPGNIREMQNIIRRAAVLTQGNRITTKVIPVKELEADNNVAYKEALNDHDHFQHQEVDLKDASGKAEYDMIQQVLKEVEYNKSRAAEILKIDRKTLYNKIRHFENKYGH